MARACLGWMLCGYNTFLRIDLTGLWRVFGAGLGDGIGAGQKSAQRGVLGHSRGIGAGLERGRLAEARAGCLFSLYAHTVLDACPVVCLLSILGMKQPCRRRQGHHVGDSIEAS